MNPKPNNTYYQYRIRKISWNEKGDNFGITIPRGIAEKYKDVKWDISVIEAPNIKQIILTSGLDLVQLKKEITAHPNRFNFDTI